MGRGYIPLPIRLRGLGARPELPQLGPGRSPGRKWILCVTSSTERISDRQKTQNDQLHFDQVLELQHILTLNQDKFGTNRVHNSGQLAFRMTPYFFRDRPPKFGTIPKNSGRMVTLTEFEVSAEQTIGCECGLSESTSVMLRLLETLLYRAKCRSIIVGRIINVVFDKHAITSVTDPRP